MTTLIHDDVFKERYANLNPEQKLAVDSIDGPVMVIAGPGTGKTTILTLRIAQILRQTDTPAHGILALTYSNAGARAMREKLREVIGNRAHDIYIHTFHSFASAMIAEYPDHFLHMRDFRQMSDVEGESLIRDIITDPAFATLRPLGRTDAYVTAILRTIADAKKDDLNPDQVRDFVKKQIKAVENDESNISTKGATKGKLKAVALEQLERLEKTLLFADVYEVYETRKKDLKLQDYGDLLINFIDALKHDLLLLRLIQERFLYLLVDEHQDTNDAQNSIISFIAEFFETPNVFIVGDEKQAIYRFQGASVENFLKLSTRWPTLQTIKLATNYRSHQSILDATFTMIENNYEEGQYADLRVQLKAGGKILQKPLDLIIGKNTAGIDSYLVKELQRIVEREPEATVAIITRWNRDLERVLRILEAADIPVSSERSVDIFHHPIGIVFFYLLEYLLDPSLTHALARTLVAGVWGVDFTQSIEIITALKRGDMSFVDTSLPALHEIQHLLVQDGALAGLVQTAELSGFTSLVARDPAFVHVWRGIVTLAESLVRETNIENPRILFENLLAYKQSAETKSVKVSIGAPDLPIKVMTAHGSKGLEFDYVFIPYAQDEAWIGRTRGASFILPKKQTSDHDVVDMRRLFYVALTRARQHATVLYAEAESDGQVLTPLRFIDELHHGHVKITELPLEETLFETPAKKKNIETEYERLIVNQAKEVLLHRGLSVTALNHFLRCPQEFLYESILNLPQAPSISAVGGLAVHEAISRIWHMTDRTVEKIERMIIDTVTEYIDKSLLATGDKEALKKELIGNAQPVATALLPHFQGPAQTGAQVLTERRVETYFETKYARLLLHGKLDAIVSTIDHADVYDYKTRQAMSVAAIKGETKNDSGDYFRQLIYYVMLMQGNNEWQRRSTTASLVFVSPDDKGRCPTVTLPVTEQDIKNVQTDIEKVVESVWSGQIAREYCDEKDCEYCAFRRI